MAAKPIIENMATGSLSRFEEQIQESARYMRPLTVLLWPNGTPNALGSSEVDKPTMTFYPPSCESTRAAMVIFPGGSYGSLAKHEGEDFAHWLSGIGIAAFVVNYRLGRNGYRHPSMLHDAARAIRIVRHYAKSWDIDHTRVGVMGSSAGGHLASTLLTQYDKGLIDHPDPIEHHSSRPDLGVLCYPVITMGTGTHVGSRKLLLGDSPKNELIDALSNEKQTSTETPPCFIWHTWEDPVVPMENAVAFAQSLRHHGVRFELHIYEKGKHGIGLAQSGSGETFHRWTNDLYQWLRERGFLLS